MKNDSINLLGDKMNFDEIETILTTLTFIKEQLKQLNDLNKKQK